MRLLKNPEALAAGSLAAILIAMLALAGCKPKESAYKATEAVSSYARDMGDAAGRATTKAGERLGLVDKKWDYVRLAWETSAKPPASAPAYEFEDEREAGRTLMAEFIARFGKLRDDSVERYLNHVTAGLAAYSDRPSAPVCVAVLMTEERRAWGLPGGYLVVTIGALRCCESESEAAGLLASVLAMSNLKCALSRMAEQQAALLPESTGKRATELSDEDFAKVVQATATNLIKDGLSETDVRSSDRTATDLLVRLGYEPGGLKAWLARVQVKRQQEAGGKPLKDYGSFKARDTAIDERLAEIHAPSLGRSIADRWRRDCSAHLPAAKF
jgi:predicted Zn-dependent protease